MLAPERARSEDWNADRLELRRKLGDLGKRILVELAGQAELVLDAHTSLHHPASFNKFQVDSLRVYFSRAKPARSALLRILGSSFKQDIDSAYRHVSLAVTMTTAGLETGLSIHPDAWWDSQNVVGKTRQGTGAAEFAAVLNQASGFTLCIHEHRPHAAGKIFRDELERALKHFQIGAHYLRFTRSHTKQSVLACDPGELTARLAADLVSLAPVHRFIAWSPENDFLFAGGAGKS